MPTYSPYPDARDIARILWHTPLMDRGAKFVMIVPLAAIAYLLFIFGHPPWTPLRILGLVLTVTATVALTISRFHLGNSFSVRPEAKALVTHGIYSRIRNPVYVFSTILLAGLILLVGRPEYFVILLILIPLQVFRARKESQLLEQHFGDAYRQYKSQTWF